MDKRWIYIFIILIIGVACSYLIVESSNTVGNANVNLNKFTVSLPSSFNVDQHDSKELLIIDRNTHERILITLLGKKDSLHSDMVDSINKLKNSKNITNIKNTTFKLGNKTYPSIYYEKNPDLVNRITYISKYDRIFSIKCYNFHDNKTINCHTQNIMDTITIDYKQSQD